jgi:hypothetical protein
MRRKQTEDENEKYIDEKKSHLKLSKDKEIKRHDLSLIKIQ